MNPRFYISTPLAQGHLPLPKEVARHIAVLRLADGDAITLFDGRGGQWHAQLRIAGKALSADVQTYDAQDRAPTLPFTLVQAMTSTDKLDYIVQKCTELGVARVLPFTAARSVVKLDGERAAKRVAHLQAVAIAACEQCGMNRVPQVAQNQSLAQCIAQLQSEGAQLITLALQDAQPLHQLPKPAGMQPVAIVIGPEGDFSPPELALLDAAKAIRASLGPRVLRTETAGLATLAMLSSLWHLNS
ncbi:MAG: 16S rRNA (uracil(1498)-N(3))-methyltransferase [Burkholderiaceae bacterium]